jgi:hypothetical protein
MKNVGIILQNVTASSINTITGIGADSETDFMYTFKRTTAI